MADIADIIKDKPRKEEKPKETVDQATIERNILLKATYEAYQDAKSDLKMRIQHKEQGFDEYDRQYRSYIRKDKWPFQSKIFIPLPFLTLFGKGTRLITGKIKGRLNATQYGNELVARIGTEILSSQYDDHDTYYEEPLVSKWFRMDQCARSKGGAFGLCGWHREVDKAGKTIYDGPTFEMLDIRKVSFPSGVNSISDCEDGVFVERTATYEKLQAINDAAKGKDSEAEPPYSETALARLKQVKNQTYNETNQSTNSQLRGLSDKRKGFRIITCYRKDYFITFCPDVGQDENTPFLTLRVIPNPYKHGLIPIVRLVYIPIDDDIVGMSELEPGRSVGKAANALTSGFIESVSVELYPIIKGHPTNVDWKTVEFKPRAAWLMNNPQTDVQRLEGAVTFTQKFVEAYRLLKSIYAEAMGETTADVTSTATLQSDKTATEVRDNSQLRSARENLNKLFLAAAVQKMYTFWWSMDQQFLTDKKVIKLTGKDALQYFIDEGLHDHTLTEDGFKLINLYLEKNEGMDFQTAYETLRQSGQLEPFAKPLYPVDQGQGKESLPKLQLEPDGKSGFLTTTNEDLIGEYRFTVDLNTIGMPTDAEDAQNIRGFVQDIAGVQKMGLMPEYNVKYKEVFEKLGERLKIHGADDFFEKVEQQPLMPQGLTPQGMMGGMTPTLPQGMPTPQPSMPQNQLGVPTGNGTITPQQLIGGMPNGGV